MWGGTRCQVCVYRYSQPLTNVCSKQVAGTVSYGVPGPFRATQGRGYGAWASWVGLPSRPPFKPLIGSLGDSFWQTACCTNCLPVMNSIKKKKRIQYVDLSKCCCSVVRQKSSQAGQRSMDVAGSWTTHGAGYPPGMDGLERASVEAMYSVPASVLATVPQLGPSSRKNIPAHVHPATSPLINLKVHSTFSSSSHPVPCFDVAAEGT